MNKTVTAPEARLHLGELLDDTERNETITVEHAGNAAIVVIPADDALDLCDTVTVRPDWRQSLERARALLRADLGDRELPIDDIIHTMREERSAQLYDALH